MSGYDVKCTIHIEADNPKDAALQAKDIVQDPNNEDWFFTTTHERKTSPQGLTAGYVAEGLDMACEQLHGQAWEAAEFMRDYLDANYGDFTELLEGDN